MPAPATIADLMREGPWQWGVRGDPHLWNDMRERLSAVPCPATADELAAVIEREFLALTGEPMSAPDYVRLDKYNHGGMSGGLVSPKWWREKALPLLRERHAEMCG
jgi:hypothetical protein